LDGRLYDRLLTGVVGDDRGHGDSVSDPGQRHEHGDGECRSGRHYLPVCGAFA
jgi:hypothetical protein